jgi:hypothetical protein
MSDTSQGDGWWQASDGKFYAPESHPDYKPPPPPPTDAHPPPPVDAPPPPSAVDESKPKGLLGKASAANDRYQEKVAAPMQEKANAASARAAGPASAGGSMFVIREDGKNGTVEIAEGRIIRTRKKTMGKDDIQTIPIKAITAVSHDRKTLGTDIVNLTVGSVSYEWKVANAEQMVADLHSQMF